MKKTILVFALLASMASFAQTSDKMDSVRSQTPLKVDSIHWSENVKITWADFKAPVPPNMTGTSAMGHMTVLAHIRTGSTTKPATVSMATVFNRTQSWSVKNEQTVKELAYFNLMFSLYEVQTRKLRKACAEAPKEDNMAAVYQKLYAQALAEVEARQNIFTNNTKMGTDAAEMARWTDVIKKDLKDFDAFK